MLNITLIGMCYTPLERYNLEEHNHAMTVGKYAILIEERTVYLK